MRGVADTTKCLALLEGLHLGGRQLKFGRPPDYVLPQPHLLDYVVGGPGINAPIARDVAAHKNPKRMKELGACCG